MRKTHGWSRHSSAVRPSLYRPAMSRGARREGKWPPPRKHAQAPLLAGSVSVMASQAPGLRFSGAAIRTLPGTETTAALALAGPMPKSDHRKESRPAPTPPRPAFSLCLGPFPSPLPGSSVDCGKPRETGRFPNNDGRANTQTGIDPIADALPCPLRTQADSKEPRQGVGRMVGQAVIGRERPGRNSRRKIGRRVPAPAENRPVSSFLPAPFSGP